MVQQQVLEGTWEEIALHAEELKGRRVRLTVVTDSDKEHAEEATPNEKMLAILQEIQARHEDRPDTNGSDTQRLLREARAGAMYGLPSAEDE